MINEAKVRYVDCSMVLNLVPNTPTTGKLPGILNVAV